ncbi:hypothetical protein DL93DRAFT_2080675 [Clavulina sp. PMI_390]|nr:hypothetical protein DL93DRAFT_2080675 [Clavulina sp. PMI_390]
MAIEIWICRLPLSPTTPTPMRPPCGAPRSDWADPSKRVSLTGTVGFGCSTHNKTGDTSG